LACSARKNTEARDPLYTTDLSVRPTASPLSSPLQSEEQGHSETPEVNENSWNTQVENCRTNFSQLDYLLMTKATEAKLNDTKDTTKNDQIQPEGIEQKHVMLLRYLQKIQLKANWSE
jgi:hypothetical protein